MQHAPDTFRRTLQIAVGAVTVLVAVITIIRALQENAAMIATVQASQKSDEVRLAAIEAMLAHDLRDLVASVSALAAQEASLSERVGIVSHRSEEADRELRKGQDDLMRAIMDTHSHNR